MSLSGCLHAYLKNQTSELTEFSVHLCMFTMAVVTFSFGSVAISYVLPVLWITSRFPIMGSVAA